MGNLFIRRHDRHELANIMVVHLRHWQAVETGISTPTSMSESALGSRKAATFQFEIAIFAQSNFRRMRANNSGSQVSNCKNTAGINEITNSILAKRAILNYKIRPDRCIHWCELRRRRREFRPFLKRPGRKVELLFFLAGKTVRPEWEMTEQLLRMA